MPTKIFSLSKYQTLIHRAILLHCPVNSVIKNIIERFLPSLWEELSHNSKRVSYYRKEQISRISECDACVYVLMIPTLLDKHTEFMFMFETNVFVLDIIDRISEVNQTRIEKKRFLGLKSSMKIAINGKRWKIIFEIKDNDNGEMSTLIFDPKKDVVYQGSHTYERNQIQASLMNQN